MAMSLCWRLVVPMTFSHSPCVTSVSPIQNPVGMVTLSCGRSSRPPLVLPIVNDPELARFARAVIGEDIGTEKVGEGEPWMASDSYSQYLTQWPGVYSFLGMQNPEKGVGAAHHNQEFDVDEDVLWIGPAVFVRVAEKFLGIE